jgi:DNA-binding phage protein
MTDAASQPANRPPLTFTTKPYKGNKPNKRADYLRRLSETQQLENYLNSLRREKPQVKTVFDIATDTGMHTETVRRILLENGHGWNGITF